MTGSLSRVGSLEQLEFVPLSENEEVASEEKTDSEDDLETFHPKKALKALLREQLLQNLSSSVISTQIRGRSLHRTESSSSEENSEDDEIERWVKKGAVVGKEILLSGGGMATGAAALVATAATMARDIYVTDTVAGAQIHRAETDLRIAQEKHDAFLSAQQAISQQQTQKTQRIQAKVDGWLERGRIEAEAKEIVAQVFNKMEKENVSIPVARWKVSTYKTVDLYFNPESPMQFYADVKVEHKTEKIAQQEIRGLENLPKDRKSLKEELVNTYAVINFSSNGYVLEIRPKLKGGADNYEESLIKNPWQTWEIVTMICGGAAVVMTGMMAWWKKCATDKECDRQIKDAEEKLREAQEAFSKANGTRLGGKEPEKSLAVLAGDAALGRQVASTEVDL